MRSIFTLAIFCLSMGAASAQLIINEVLYDPSNNELEGDANGDGTYDQEYDSFIEFVNIGETNFDASNYKIWDDLDNGELRYTIPEGTIVPPNGALVVFGGGPLVGDFGGAIVLALEGAEAGMNLNNSGEVIVIQDADDNTVLTFDSDALSNNPNESYTRNPDITGEFEQHNDNTPILFSPGTQIDGTPFNTDFVVETIEVSAEGGDLEITEFGGTLQMLADVQPDFAANTEVTWSVPEMNGVATIDDNGLLTAEGDGTVVVTATANDDSGVSDSAEVVVTGQSIGLFESDYKNSVNVYPNPAQSFVSIDTDARISELEVFNITGQLVIREVNIPKRFDVSQLNQGVYLLRVKVDEQWMHSKFVKE
ncbi:MAG: T9SS type A sorting domain-containing protein [Flavobacteriales bacterium]|nr:T9SS type A sorting domain-containing protein [Flavobacteriales bacterium]